MNCHYALHRSHDNPLTILSTQVHGYWTDLLPLLLQFDAILLVHYLLSIQFVALAVGRPKSLGSVTLGYLATWLL